MDARRRIVAGNSVNGVLAALMRRLIVSTTARLAAHNAVVCCYRHCYTAAKRGYFRRRRINVVKMQSPRRICGVSLADRIHNEELHRIAGTSEDGTVRMKKNVQNGKKKIYPEGMYEKVDDSGQGERESLTSRRTRYIGDTVIKGNF